MKWLLLLLISGCAGWHHDDHGEAIRRAEVQFNATMEKLSGVYGIARGVQDAK